MAVVDGATVLAAMNMPPEEAIKLLESKGLVVSDSWRDLWKSAHARAFTVARTAGFDVLGDIRSALTDVLDKGLTFEWFEKQITPVLQAKGWWGKAIDPETGEILKNYEGTSRAVEYGSPRRLQLIYAQNTQVAFMAGRYQAMMEATGTHPYWQYVAVLDSRTRPAHRALHGRVFRHDDPVWAVAYPPNGWRCRCRVRPLSEARLTSEKLQVSEGAGHIHTLEVKRRDAQVDTVKYIKLPGMKTGFKPDVGWDYNAAAAYFGAAA
jgi:SPP1 gp7 family putative phage head morphogenesis protein